MQDLINTVMMGNDGMAWARALGVAAAILITIKVVFWRLLARLEKWAEKTQTGLDDMVAAVLQETKIFFLLTTAVWAGSQSLSLPQGVEDGLWIAFRVVLVLQAAVWTTAAFRHWLTGYRATLAEDNPGAATGLTAVSVVVRTIIWSVFLLVALQNIGIQVTPLITGLGIGGIAVALAVQNVLSDLLASLSIIFDRPFEVGDFVIVDDLAGTVENVGLKTTRMTSLTGEQLVFGNSDLLGSRIKNYKRMTERRVLFSLGVEYGTPKKALEAIPQIVRESVEAQDHTRFDRCHFNGFGDSALLFEVVYYMLVPEYAVYMDVQQGINLDLYERFEAKGIEFAFPTQTIHVRQATS